MEAYRKLMRSSGLFNRVPSSLSDNHIPIRERKWEDITATEFSHKYEF